ncbi:hypothetical protein FNYG_00108 [Fusarium nygamai]|uniref:Uncharacterized protein n=1 Tax=Gibberella nygamai TaxID=42673 RepID=A0A2K0WVX4_GIBNY|nr:hypothetical protein FNYG_00108 [Fusarium nygamai]
MANWDIDGSCEPHRRVLDEAFDVALEMATAASDAMEFLRTPRPAKRQRKLHLEWSIKSRALKAALGLNAQDDGANPSTDFTFAQVIFKRIKTRLSQSSSVANPTRNIRLQRLGYTKPRLMCGENTEGENANFIWVGKDDPVPGEDGILLRDHREARAAIARAGSVGAWIHQGRMVFVKSEKQKGFICGQDMAAVTDYRFDWIFFCDRSFRRKVQRRTSPKAYKEIDGKTKKVKDRTEDKIFAGKSLGSIAGHLSVTVLHELFHWYGLPKIENGN